ncbi:hypothetical protein HZC34_02260 [Candidatus Saganbacteria bacterium]|nr:hypothetical protein [Candidatus Saganbacteria bacterium]
MKLSGREKATIFLSILGSETSSAILRYLPEELADIIASSINHLPTPTPEALGEVFADFNSYVALPPKSKASEKPAFEIPEEFRKTGIDYSGPKAPGDKDRIYHSSSKKIAYLLSSERPQIAAFMLSKLPPMQREEVLMNITVSRDQIDDILSDIKPTPLSDELKDKLIEHFSEKL